MVLPIDVLRKDTFCHFVCKFSQIFIHISIFFKYLVLFHKASGKYLLHKPFGK